MMPWARGEGLVPGPALWQGDLAPYLHTRPKRCAILLDRHVHKNGGSTMRDLFLEHERLGFGLYQGYTQMYWRKIEKELLALAHQAAARKEAPRHFLMFEAHFGHVEVFDTVMPGLQNLQQVYKGAGVDCPITLVTRVRDPLDYYISFFKWGVGFRQRDNPGTFGNNFTAWASRVPDLQSSLVLRGMSASGPEYLGRFRHADRHRVDFGKVEAMLDQFSVVGTVERFDETLLLTADLTGLPLLRYKRNTPPNKGGYRGTRASICPDIEACRRLIKHIAPTDYKMYEKYKPLFEKRLQALGDDFARRVALLKEDISLAQPFWKAAPRKQTICRFHPEQSTSAENLRVANLRCPVHDSPSLCQSVYARRLFECPWQYVANSSLSDPLGCFRPSSGFSR